MKVKISKNENDFIFLDLDELSFYDKLDNILDLGYKISATTQEEENEVIKKHQGKEDTPGVLEIVDNIIRVFSLEKL